MKVFLTLAALLALGSALSLIATSHTEDMGPLFVPRYCDPCSGGFQSPQFLGNWNSLKGHVDCVDGKTYVKLNPSQNYAFHGGYVTAGHLSVSAPWRRTEYSAYPLTFEEDHNGCRAFFEVPRQGHGMDPQNKTYQPFVRFAHATWEKSYPAVEGFPAANFFMPFGMASCCLGIDNACGKAEVNVDGTGLLLEKTDFVGSGWPNAGRNGRARASSTNIELTGGDYCGDLSPISPDGNSYSNGRIYVKPLEYGGKVRICHRTNAIENPYVSIEVDWHAVDGSDPGSDHRGQHVGQVFDKTIHTANSMDWGDIIPPIPELNLVGVNFGAAGQKIWNNNCQAEVAPPTTPTITNSAAPQPNPNVNDWEDIWNDISCGQEGPQ